MHPFPAKNQTLKILQSTISPTKRNSARETTQALILQKVLSFQLKKFSTFGFVF